MEISHSSLAYIKLIINIHNEEIITEKKTLKTKQKLYQILEIIMEKYTPEPAKARLKHDIKTTKIIPLQKL